MESIFKSWKTNRKLYLDYFDKYSLAQLNKVPTGFNNNLIWNIGHVVVAQQAIIYKGANLPMNVSDDLFNLYKSGTKPTHDVSQNEVDEIKTLLISLIEQTEKDFSNGKFVSINERTTGTGFHLASIKDAFEFNNYHEGLHFGCMMSIRKFV